MAFIEGLEDQKAALKRVKDNLTEISKTDESISNLEMYANGATKKEFRIECEFIMPDDSLKKLKIPVQINDNKFLLDALLRQRETVAAKVREDSSKYRITLSPQEMDLLNRKVSSDA